MPLEYSKARNNSLTCSYNGISLHSSYNPEVEADRFAASLSPDFIPENIFVIEPVLGYAYNSLKKRFPLAKIYSIRILQEIHNTISFDSEFLFKSETQLENDLFNYFGESELLNSFFVNWPASANALKCENASIWNVLRKVLKTCQNILATRQYFSERWIKNSFNYFYNLKQVSNPDKLKLPVLVCASGPSLNSSLDHIKKYQNSFFILACSSAIKTLLHNDIKPDLFISTDGGFWAKKHLYCLKNYSDTIRIAVPSEANIPLWLYKKAEIVPLAYCDNFDSDLFEALHIPFTKAKRNGTISGTAAELALSLTSENVYLCGVDLESSKGFVHTQPNELEIENSIRDSRLTPQEKRIYLSGRESTQLEIYRNWFTNNSHTLGKRLFRISNNYNFNHKLGNIKDISFSDLDEKKFPSKKDLSLFSETKKLNYAVPQLKALFENLIHNEKWQENYFPADYMMIKRKNTENIIDNHYDRLSKKLDKIISFIETQTNK